MSRGRLAALQAGQTILQDMHHRLTRSLPGSISQALQASLRCQLHDGHVPGSAGACSQQQRPFASDTAAEPVQAVSSGDHPNATNSMDFPGGRVPFTDRLVFVGGALSLAPPMSCYRTLDSTGAHHSGVGIAVHGIAPSAEQQQALQVTILIAAKALAGPLGSMDGLCFLST